MTEIGVFQFKIYVENQNGKEQAVCPNCGVLLSYMDLQRMPPAETGFFYCSEKCAKEHVEKEMKVEKVSE